MSRLHLLTSSSSLDDTKLVMVELGFVDMARFVKSLRFYSSQAISKESVKYRDLVKKIGDEADLILLELSEVDQELLTGKVKSIEEQFERLVNTKIGIVQPEYLVMFKLKIHFPPPSA